jgi:2-oxoglutarate ferredoxin oxidoreductase subunit beta
MVQRDKIAWCPGCGNFGIRNVLEAVIKELPIPRKDIAFTSGIG